MRWLREVPDQIRRGTDRPVRLALKLMNARFDDAFQLEMLRASSSADTLVVFNRLWDPALGVAYGGYDLSERNLRVLELASRNDFSLPPLVASGNVGSGRILLDYARAGCESVQLHTGFQLPLSEYACHSRVSSPACPACAGL